MSQEDSIEFITHDSTPPPQHHALDRPSLAEAVKTLITTCSSTKNVAAVRAFLESTVPSMGDLTPIFLQGGIDGEECLAGLRALPPSEQLEYLGKDLLLNAFQARVIRSRLNRAVGDSTLGEDEVNFE